MTQICAMCKSLLKGEVLSIMTGFKWFGITNIPREISRSIEQKFNVQVSRIKKDFTSRYGQPGFYFEYRLNRTDYNKEGIEKMEQYVREIENKAFNPPVKRGRKKVNVTQNPLPKAKQNNLFNE